MSDTYLVKPGDTLQKVSRRVYGVATGAGLIKDANPWVAGTLTPGTILQIPADTGQPEFTSPDVSGLGPDETTIFLEGRRFRFWNSLTFTRNMDSVSTFRFTAPWEPDNAEIRNAFRPFSYNEAVISVGAQRVITGTQLNTIARVEPQSREMTSNGYSLPGVLMDCTSPASFDASREFSDITLRQVAELLAKPFGIRVVFSSALYPPFVTLDEGAPFDKVAIKPWTPIYQFLADLARQRGMILGGDASGALVFFKSAESGAAVASFAPGHPHLVSLEPMFNAQRFFSHVSGLTPVTFADAGGVYTVPNPHLSNVLRPLTYVVPDVEIGESVASIEAKAGRMVGNAISYRMTVSTWRDEAGDLWAPSTFIDVESPDVMIFSKYRFLVRRVSFTRDAKKQFAELDLTIPGSFSGKIAERMPWDG